MPRPTSPPPRCPSHNPSRPRHGSTVWGLQQEGRLTEDQVARYYEEVRERAFRAAHRRRCSGGMVRLLLPLSRFLPSVPRFSGRPGPLSRGRKHTFLHLGTLLAPSLHVGVDRTILLALCWLLNQATPTEAAAGCCPKRCLFASRCLLFLPLFGYRRRRQVFASVSVDALGGGDGGGDATGYQHRADAAQIIRAHRGPVFVASNSPLPHVRAWHGMHACCVFFGRVHLSFPV